MTPLLTRQDLCKTLGISQSTLDRWIRAGKFPPPDFRFGPRSPRWKPDPFNNGGLEGPGFH